MGVHNRVGQCCGSKNTQYRDFKSQSLQTTWFPVNGTPDALYTTSNRGWTTNEIGMHWLKEVFLPETSTNRHRLLILDGHGSHITTDFMWECYQNKVILL